jgi:hypothetical protein
LEAGLRALQSELSADPTAGDLDAGTGGLRKIRMPDADRNKGKRSGARVHYLLLAEHAVIYLMFVYTKDEISALSTDQKKALKRIVDEIKFEWNARRLP